jgi:hypothetical protein
LLFVENQIFFWFCGCELPIFFQGIVEESEWQTFVDNLKTGLPMSFRISATSKFATVTRDTMKNEWLVCIAEGSHVSTSDHPN